MMQYLRSFFSVIAVIWELLTAPRGTVEQAIPVARAHMAEIHQIVAIVRRDPALGWVTPGLKPKDMTQENGPLTRSTVVDYNAIAALLQRGRFRDLSIMRDKSGRHDPIFMRFVVFDSGWFGATPFVLAEWAAPGELLDPAKNRDCRPVGSGWSVCPQI